MFAFTIFAFNFSTQVGGGGEGLCYDLIPHQLLSSVSFSKPYNCLFLATALSHTLLSMCFTNL